MTRSNRRSPEQLEHQIAEFNRRHPVGTRVTYHRSRGGVMETETLGAARLTADHAPVIKLRGIPCAVHLDRISIPRDTTPTDGSAA